MCALCVDVAEGSFNRTSLSSCCSFSLSKMSLLTAAPDDNTIQFCLPHPWSASQVPLHAGAPPTDAPLRMTSLDDTPRVPCASLLVRIMTPGGCVW
jgi:hypothetical protein